MYPKVWLLPKSIARLANMNSVLDPTDPGLAPLEQQVRARLAPDASASELLAVVEQVVCERIAYAWDWEVWGVVEYLPTVAEALEQGREDCDGRAVVAASLLRRLGHEAWLVSDILHCWVETESGETMSPTGGDKTLVGGAQGTKTTISLGLLRNIGRGLSFGIAVFPLERELIILVTLCLLTMQPRSSVRRRIIGCLLMCAALFLMRYSGEAAARFEGSLDVAIAGVGFGLAIVAWSTLAIRAADRPSCSVQSPSE